MSAIAKYPTKILGVFIKLLLKVDALNAPAKSLECWSRKSKSYLPTEFNMEPKKTPAPQSRGSKIIEGLRRDSKKITG